MRTVLVALMTLAAAPAAGIEFDLPVDCAMGAVCTVQNYVDHDPGRGRVDYACGRLSYDGHDGTDIRVPDLVTMRQGVAVVAAAPGRVVGVRDRVPDEIMTDPAKVEGIEAGNGVGIDHGDGWFTQYSHLRLGSVAVEVGDEVEAGDLLGLIGLSGRTEFPHLEFAVRFQDRPVDPFVGLVPFDDCTDAREPLWSDAALSDLDYQETGLLIAGFATGPVEGGDARTGLHALRRFHPASPALVMWVDLFGTMAGDRHRFVITGPGGAEVTRSETAQDESQVSRFVFAGRRRPDGGWAPGEYTGRYRLVRDGETVIDYASGFEIE